MFQRQEHLCASLRRNLVTGQVEVFQGQRGESLANQLGRGVGQLVLREVEARYFLEMAYSLRENQLANLVCYATIFEGQGSQAAAN